MYVLHYAPDNASLIIRLALEEAGLPYRTALVDRSTRAQDSAAYRALNPTGLIPAFETPQGVLFETGAILLWLADRHPEAGLAPQINSPDRGNFLKWLFFLSNTVHADLRQLFYPQYFVPETAVNAHHDLLAARMQRHFALLDAAVAADPALFAAPSSLALYSCTLLRWSAFYPEDGTAWFHLSDTPALAALAATLDARPATRAAARAEGLGVLPFTAPHHPTPPEGSAT